MKFSVLLSVYKNEDPQFLDAALSSIWSRQLLKPSEIILVEDGLLTSDLYDVLNKWSSKIQGRIFIRIPLSKNLGLGRALNEGLKHCSNEWVFRMDTDDICTPDRFQKQVNFIKRNPDIDIFSTQVLEFNEYIDNPTGVRQVPLTHPEIVKYSKWRSPFNHMSVAYRKSIIEFVGGYQHHLLMEDYNLWLRVLNSGYKSANLPDCLVFVRAGSQMIKRRRGLNYIKSEWKLFQLKRDIGYQKSPNAFCVFLARSIPRALPSKLLSKFYINLRKS